MISVVIPNYNRKDLLESCLRSLAAQTFREFEVVVVDNGSADGSAEMTAERFPEARVVRLEKNTGFSAAVNRGIDVSTGELVALLNNDADADPDWLKEMDAAARAHPEAGFFASKMLFYDRRDLIDTVADAFTVAGYGYKKGWGEFDRGQYDGLKDIFGACGGAAMYRRGMLEAVRMDGQYFDEDYFAFGEDNDISFRARAQGYGCMAVPAAKVYHRVRATAGVSSELSIFLGYRNFLMTVLKNFPAAVMLRHSLSLAAFCLLSALNGFAKTGRLTVLRAYMDVIRKSGLIKRKRKAVLAASRLSGRQFDALLERGWFSIWVRNGFKTAGVRKILKGGGAS